MAGNSSRRGAIRKNKKGPSAGSGGQKPKRLGSRGPTPKAEDRPYHTAAKRKASKNSRRPRADKKFSGSKLNISGELVAGRNATQIGRAHV